MMGMFGFKKKQEKKSLHVKIEKEMNELQDKLNKQNEQIQSVFAAENRFEENGDIDSLISFWEEIWESGGLLFNGSKWTFRLPDLYIEQKRYDDAFRILKLIDNQTYKEKVDYYIKKIEKAKSKK